MGGAGGNSNCLSNGDWDIPASLWLPGLGFAMGVVHCRYKVAQAMVCSGSCYDRLLGHQNGIVV